MLFAYGRGCGRRLRSSDKTKSTKWRSQETERLLRYPIMWDTLKHEAPIFRKANAGDPHSTWRQLSPHVSLPPPIHLISSTTSTPTHSFNLPGSNFTAHKRSSLPTKGRYLSHVLYFSCMFFFCAFRFFPSFLNLWFLFSRKQKVATASCLLDRRTHTLIMSRREERA
jgi:hypothetical protein